MRRRTAVIGLGVVIAAIAGACAVDIPDVVMGDGGEDSSTNDVASGGDASDAGAPDVIVVPTCDASCGYSLPSGFGLVLFATGSQVCPSGSLPNPVNVDPDASAACSCGCTITQQPDCWDGVIQRFYDLNNTTALCNANAQTLDVDGSTCMQHNIPSANHRSGIPPTPDGGACTAQGTTNASAVTTTPGVACVATSCNTQTCSAPPGFKLCALSSGQASCPAPFTQQHAVGVGNLSCSGCGCALSGACAGVIHRFSDNLCQTPSGDDPVDGGCATVATTNTSSYNYTGWFTGTCTPTGTPSPTVTTVQTLCCLP